MINEFTELPVNAPLVVNVIDEFCPPINVTLLADKILYVDTVVVSVKFDRKTTVSLDVGKDPSGDDGYDEYQLFTVFKFPVTP